MAAPNIVASTTGVNNSNSPTHTIPMAQTPAAGNLLLVICSFDGDCIPSSLEESGDGMTLVDLSPANDRLLGASADHAVFAYRKTADGDEGDHTLTLDSSEKGTWHVYEIANADNDDANWIIAEVLPASTQVTVEIPELTGLDSGTDYRAIATGAWDDNSNLTDQGLTGYSNILETITGGSGNAGLVSAHKALTGVTSDNPADATLPLARTVMGLSFAIPEAGGGGDTTAPDHTVAPVATNISVNSFDIVGTPDEDGDVRGLVLADGATAPVAADFDAVTPVAMTNGVQYTFPTGDISGTFAPSTEVDAYVRLDDSSGNQRVVGPINATLASGAGGSGAGSVFDTLVIQ